MAEIRNYAAEGVGLGIQKAARDQQQILDARNAALRAYQQMMYNATFAPTDERASFQESKAQEIMDPYMSRGPGGETFYTPFLQSNVIAKPFTMQQTLERASNLYKDVGGDVSADEIGSFRAMPGLSDEAELAMQNYNFWEQEQKRYLKSNEALVPTIQAIEDKYINGDIDKAEYAQQISQVRDMAQINNKRLQDAKQQQKVNFLGTLALPGIGQELNRWMQTQDMYNYMAGQE